VDGAGEDLQRRFIADHPAGDSGMMAVAMRADAVIISAGVISLAGIVLDHGVGG